MSHTRNANCPCSYFVTDESKFPTPTLDVTLQPHPYPRPSYHRPYPKPLSPPPDPRPFLSRPPLSPSPISQSHFQFESLGPQSSAQAPSSNPSSPFLVVT